MFLFLCKHFSQISIIKIACLMLIFFNLKSLQSNLCALSLYRSKMILDGPNCFRRVQFVLVGLKLFWSGPNHWSGLNYTFLDQLYNLDLSKMIWTPPKRIGFVQNNWYFTKIIWTVQNHFGPIEGQDIKFQQRLALAHYCALCVYYICSLIRLIQTDLQDFDYFHTLANSFFGTNNFNLIKFDPF